MRRIIAFASVVSTIGIIVQGQEVLMAEQQQYPQSFLK
jgi:hypothetical protein